MIKDISNIIHEYISEMQFLEEERRLIASKRYDDMYSELKWLCKDYGQLVLEIHYVPFNRYFQNMMKRFDFYYGHS